MSIAETSLEAFYNKKQKGTLTGDRLKAFRIIQKHQPISASMIARKMQKPYHKVSGKITELKNQNRIEIAGHTKNRFGNTTRTYQVKK